MNDPFQILGVPAGSTLEQVREAYIALVKRYHPDRFPDPEDKANAQEKLISINLAYEKLSRQLQSQPVRDAEPDQEVSVDEAIQTAQRMLKLNKPHGAIRQLSRSRGRSALWYYVRGEALMQLEQFGDAKSSFREAVRREPDNHQYHSKAFEAEMAEKKSNTFPERFKSFFKKKMK